MEVIITELQFLFQLIQNLGIEVYEIEIIDAYGNKIIVK